MEAYAVLPADAPPSSVAVFAILRDQGPVSTTTLHTETPLSSATVRNATRFLQSHDVVVVESDLTDNRRGISRRYLWLPDEHDPPRGTASWFG